MAVKYLDNTGLAYFWGKCTAKFQDKLSSGTNIKTVNSNSLVGSGDVAITLANLGVHISTSDPTSADGNNGDIWIKYEVSE